MSPSNPDRADWAEYALTAFSSQTGADCDMYAVHDLIADLGHYCSRHRLDFVSIAARAISAWAYERKHPNGLGSSPQVTVAIEGRASKRAWRTKVGAP